jgi:alcohol dehydrogenase
MDAAKVIAVSIANPKKPLRSLAGLLQGPEHAAAGLRRAHHRRHRQRGHGGRRDRRPERQSKLVIVDPRMVPKMAALDPSLCTGLPPHITAATGIDALTHAVESFVGNWATPYTDGMALAAVGLIFENLRTACSDGGNLQAREKMLLASTYAGMAFTRANVGYVHAIAHQFGGRYHTPARPGQRHRAAARAALRCPTSPTRLAALAVRARLGDGQGQRAGAGAEVFIDGVDALKRDLGIPTHLAALREKPTSPHWPRPRCTRPTPATRCRAT